MITTQLKPYVRHASNVNTLVAPLKAMGILGGGIYAFILTATLINLANDARGEPL